MLQRAVVNLHNSYAIDFADCRGRGGVTLLMMDNKGTGDESVTTIFAFGRNDKLDAISGKFFPPTLDDLRWALPYRWAVGGEYFFLAPRLRFGDDVIRLALNILLNEPDDAKRFFVGRSEGCRERAGPTKLIPSGLGTPRYTWLSPLSSNRAGVVSWENADSTAHARFPAHERVQTFHYDFRAIDGIQLELFVTADGALSKWLFDGKTWKNEKFYDLQVTGEFMVWDRGESLVTERDGTWSLIRGIDRPNPVVRALVQRVDGEPLILVDDTVKRTTLFLHRDQIFDDESREVRRLARDRQPSERIRDAIDLAVSRRGP